MSDLEILSAEMGTVALLNKSEIDQQIATAHRYPRSIKRFRDEALAMVTLNEQIEAARTTAIGDTQTLANRRARWRSCKSMASHPPRCSLSWALQAKRTSRSST